MKTFGGIIGVAAAVVLCGAPSASANNKAATVPAKVMSARTVYVDNRTPDAELQNNAYMELAKWGRLQLVDSPKKADVVLRLSSGNTVTFVPAGERVPIYDGKAANRSAAEEESIPTGFTRIEIIETRTGNPLWTEQRKTVGVQGKRRVLDGLRGAIEQQEMAQNR